MRGVRVNDTVLVASGADRGKRGKVVRILSAEDTVLVEGIHMVFEHVRKSRKNPQGGGRLEREAPVHLSKVVLVCPHCDKPARTGRKVLETGARTRVCRKCKKEIR